MLKGISDMTKPLGLGFTLWRYPLSDLSGYPPQSFLFLKEKLRCLHDTNTYNLFCVICLRGRVFTSVSLLSVWLKSLMPPIPPSQHFPLWLKPLKKDRFPLVLVYQNHMVQVIRWIISWITGQNVQKLEIFASYLLGILKENCCEGGCLCP